MDDGTKPVKPPANPAHQLVPHQHHAECAECGEEHSFDNSTCAIEWALIHECAVHHITFYCWPLNGHSERDRTTYIVRQVD